ATGVRNAPPGLAPGSRRGAPAADPRIARLLLAGQLLLAQRLELLLGAVAAIGGARLQHALQNLAIAIEAPCLEVWSLIGIQPEPLHPLEDHAYGFIRRALAVGVFDAQDEFAAHATRVQPA